MINLRFLQLSTTHQNMFWLILRKYKPSSVINFRFSIREEQYIGSILSFFLFLFFYNIIINVYSLYISFLLYFIIYPLYISFSIQHLI